MPNGLASKNSIFEFSRFVARFFAQPGKRQSVFAGVALMEEFDVENRGANQGSSAIQRVNINMEDFGTTGFSSAVDLPKPLYVWPTSQNKNHPGFVRLYTDLELEAKRLSGRQPGLAVTLPPLRGGLACSVRFNTFSHDDADTPPERLSGHLRCPRRYRARPEQWR